MIEVIQKRHPPLYIKIKSGISKRNRKTLSSSGGDYSKEQGEDVSGKTG